MTATSATALFKSSTESVIEAGAPAAVSKLEVKLSLVVSASVNIASVTVPGLIVLVPSETFSCVSALQV